MLSDSVGAIFQDNIKRRADIDMQAKIREDPLYQIRQKEEESRKRLLQNPVKLKQLQRLVGNNKCLQNRTCKHKHLLKVNCLNFR